ncbi:MAG: hypothetical protein H6727_12145 [Myxococcales bacterium]|nr:hypothetical protein [Myxococcales bacterium]
MLHSYRFLPLLLLFTFTIFLQQNCIAEQTLEGFACTKNEDCGANLTCVTGRCGACTADNDCTSKGSNFVCCIPQAASGTGPIKERYCRQPAKCDTATENVSEPTGEPAPDAGEVTPEPTTEGTAETKTCTPACDESKNEICCDGTCKLPTNCSSIKDCTSEKDCPVGQFCCAVDRLALKFSKCFTFATTLGGAQCVENKP